MYKHRKSCIIALILSLLLIFNTAAAFAEAGDGTGGGNGENRDIPLTLESSSVTDGMTGVAVNETIQLNFNKNICNVTVLSNNKKCFHLTEEDGTPVAIKLIFPDNQVQHEHRHEVFIQAAEDLQPNTVYRISVDNTLMAKNGTSIDNAHTITFTTGSERTSETNTVLSKLGDYIVTYETASGENENSVPVNKEGLDDVSEDTGTDTGSISKIAIIFFVVLLVAFTATIILIKCRKE